MAEQEPCKECGHCPTCGRGVFDWTWRQPIYIDPWYVPAPINPPYWYQTPYCGAGTTATTDTVKINGGSL